MTDIFSSSVPLFIIKKLTEIANQLRRTCHLSLYQIHVPQESLFHNKSVLCTVTKHCNSRTARQTKYPKKAKMETVPLAENNKVDLGSVYFQSAGQKVKFARRVEHFSFTMLWHVRFKRLQDIFRRSCPSKYNYAQSHLIDVSIENRKVICNRSSETSYFHRRHFHVGIHFSLYSETIKNTSSLCKGGRFISKCIVI